MLLEISRPEKISSGTMSAAAMSAESSAEEPLRIKLPFGEAAFATVMRATMERRSFMEGYVDERERESLMSLVCDM